MQAKPRILVIDDDEAILGLIRDTLASRYDVEATAEWLNGTDRLMREDYDLLILDLAMPVFDGPEFVKRLRANRQRKHMPILVISAYPNLRARVDANKVDGILAKPFPLTELDRAVDKLVGGSVRVLN